MSSGKKISRRRFLATTAAASAVTLAPPFIRTSNAAGKLKVAFWDHWVPGANDTMKAICHEWGAKHKVDISIDFITSQGSKLELTIAAEKLSKSGHDLVQPSAWSPAAYADDFEPVDDIMHAAIKHNGEPYPIVEYLGKPKGHWVAAPAVTGSQVKPPQARISRLKEYAGLDVTEMYAPPGGHSNKKLQDEWTWEKFVEVAEKCHKGGHPFGLGLSQTTDSVDWAGALFHAFGAELVNAKGDVTVNSDNTRHVLEYAQRLVRVLPKDVIAWDDASNNKFLISGQGSLIMNPPSAWAVAKRDNIEVAKDTWIFASPKGPKGRYAPALPFFWAVWKFSPNKSAAKSLLAHLITRHSSERLVAASVGYDIPGFKGLRDFKTWAEVEPPKGVVYNYPPTPDQIVMVAGAPAPIHVANQIYTQGLMTQMMAKVGVQGQSIKDTIGWAENQLKAYTMM
jgi:ABC-type glycerol-3-phosphate transport system substrate-binding protein